MRRARSLARARLFDEDPSPGSPTAIETTSRATTRARMSIDDVEKMNSHTNLTLTARLDRLRADARLLHARAVEGDLDDVAVDPCAIAAERRFRDAVARALVADAETTLGERRARHAVWPRRCPTSSSTRASSTPPSTTSECRPHLSCRHAGS